MLPRGYKLITPTEDDSLAECVLESCAPVKEDTSFKAVVATAVQDMKSARDRKLSLLEMQEKNRAEELQLARERLKLEEERMKQAAAKDELMMRALAKLAGVSELG